MGRDERRFYGDGITDLAVAGSSASANSDSTIAILLGNGNGTFHFVGSYGASAANPYFAPPSLLAADFNGDGLEDFVVTGQDFNGATSQFFAGRGDGSFSTQPKHVYLQIASGPMVLADVNGDGQPDLVGAAILISNGDGTFRATNTNILLAGTKFAAADDLDGDGNVDLAACTGQYLYFVKGNGDGTFQTPVQVGMSSGFTAIADLNDDGKLDILVSAEGGFGVYYGQANGTFIPASYGIAGQPQSILAGDFNGDNRTDLVITALKYVSASDPYHPYINLYSGRPIGATRTGIVLSSSSPSSTFGQPVSLSATVTPSGATGKVTFYDGVNTLGTAPLANGIARLPTSSLSADAHTLTARYSGDPIYSPSVSVPVAQTTRTNSASKLVLAGYINGPTGTGYQKIALGDFNGDGITDFVATIYGENRGILVFTGLTNGLFERTVFMSNLRGGNGIVAGDFNMDGKLDFATSDGSVYFGNGDGTFADPVYVADPGPQQIATADFDGDGSPDLMISGVVHLNNGDGTFQAGPVGRGVVNPVTVADFNGDLRPDVIGNGLAIGTGFGSFFNTTEPYYFPYAVGDLNHDGNLDLLIGWMGDSMATALGNGNGTFMTPFTVSSSPVSILLADFDGDGALDILESSDQQNTYILRGNGDGTFQSPALIYAGFGYQTALDVNGDGRMDLITVPLGGSLAVRLGVPASVNASTTTLTNVAPLNLTTTLTATVMPLSATGTVTFYDNGTKLGTTPVAAGAASLAVSLGGGGLRLLTAAYSGDAGNASSFSQVVLQALAGTPPVLLPATLPAATVGQPYTYTFHASGGTPPYQFGWQSLSGGFTSSFTIGNGSGIPAGQLNALAVQAGIFSFSLVVSDAAGLQTAQTYQIVVNPGTSSVSAASVTSISPAAASGNDQIFTFQFSDTSGASTLSVLNILINNALDGRRACYLAYVPQSGIMYLVNDSGDGTFAGSIVLNGGTGMISNSQCLLQNFASSASFSGNVLTLNVSLSFGTSFAGNKVIYMAARDTAGNNSGWQTMGVYGVTSFAPPAYPSPISMFPRSGKASNTVLSFAFQDDIAATNIQTAWALINTAIDGRVACYVAYYRPANQLYLIPDSGDGAQSTTMILSGNNTVSNSQCTVSAQGSSAIVNGTQLVLTLNIAFKPAFTGPKGVWMALQNLAGKVSNWEALGAWQVP